MKENRGKQLCKDSQPCSCTRQTDGMRMTLKQQPMIDGHCGGETAEIKRQADEMKTFVYRAEDGERAQHVTITQPAAFKDHGVRARTTNKQSTEEYKHKAGASTDARHGNSTARQQPSVVNAPAASCGVADM